MAIGQVNPGGQVGGDSVLVKPKRQFGQFVADVVVREVHTDTLEITDQPVEQGASVADHAFKRPAELVIEMMWSNSPQQGFAPPPVPPRQSITSVVTDAIKGVLGPVDAIAGEVRQVVNMLSPPKPPSSPLGANLAGAGIDQVRDVYAKLLALQESRVPFDVITGKRKYTNMLVRTLTQTTDKETENSLHITATLRQVIIAQAVTRTVSAPAANQQQPGSTAAMADKGSKQLSDAQNINAASAARAGIDAVNAKVGAEADRLVNSSVQDIADSVSSRLPI